MLIPRSAVVDVDQVEEILFFEIASSSKSRSAAILLPFLWLVVDVVGGGVQSFFLRVMVGTGYPHPAQCEFAYPPVYIDYIIILSYVEWTTVYRFYISGLRKRIVVGGE